MSRRLFVGNLSFETTDVELKELFATAGACDSAAVIRDRTTGRSRGFAFVAAWRTRRRLRVVRPATPSSQGRRKPPRPEGPEAQSLVSSESRYFLDFAALGAAFFAPLPLRGGGSGAATLERSSRTRLVRNLRRPF